MLTINSDKIPNGIMYNFSYIIYYSFLWYIFQLFFISLIARGINLQLSDYQIFVLSWLFAFSFWILTSIIITPIEKKIIKRNIFVAGIIQVLKKHRSIKFEEVIENYSYFLFQNKKVMSWDYEWASYIEALVAIWTIEVKNHKHLKEKCKDFDYNQFRKKLYDVELSLIDKKVNIYELIKRLDNFIL